MCPTMPAVPVAFLLDVWHIFCIKTGSHIHLPQLNMFLNSGCMRMSSSWSVSVSLQFLWLLSPASPCSAGSGVCGKQHPVLCPPLRDVGEMWLCAAADQCLHKESSKFPNVISLNRAIRSEILSWSWELFVNS